MEDYIRVCEKLENRNFWTAVNFEQIKGKYIGEGIDRMRV